MADLGRHEESGRGRGGHNLSRAERLETILVLATVGISECSAWIIPMLEHGGW
jgi:hypothetical protein